LTHASIMHASAFALLIALVAPAGAADTGRVAFEPLAVELPSRLVLPISLQLVEDTTPRRRRKAVEVSEWYERRLRIHRYGAYTMIPLFTFQAIAGNQLYNKSSGAPGWAKTGHRYGATGLATVFGVNTVTGLWNLWDSRAVPQGRGRRTLHTLLMLASDAGFTYAGVRLADQAENSAEKRRQHRTWAYGSMATAIAGSGVMVLWR
ncbi:MAG: hypothetical protein JWL95_335, partial [Gemmatimonadetes bacterium]|nr:hypothetical protein [Gemmatimonadota bacterium]